MDTLAPVELYCICRQPYNEKFMISCDTCSFALTHTLGTEWYHSECIHLSQAECKKLKKWDCPKCVAALTFPPYTEKKSNRKKSIMIEFERDTSEYPLEKSFNTINSANTLVLKQKFTQTGKVYGLNISHDGNLLATCSSAGTVKIFDLITLKPLIEYMDEEERHIDEFFVVAFSKDDHYVFTGGKRKNRYEWEEEEKDNKIMECPLKMFSLLDPNKTLSIMGHTEEITCVKVVEFKGEEYCVTSSVDGSLMKCKFRNNMLVEKIQIMDGKSSIVYSFSFLPGYRNKYFLAATDDNIKLFDFKSGEVLQEFPTSFSGGFCNCIKFIDWNNEDHHVLIKGAAPNDEKNGDLHHLITLKRLVELDDQFDLLDVMDFDHKDYQSTELCSTLVWNGNYVFSTSENGKVFVWSDQKIVAILDDHGKSPVRDIKLHPKLQYLITCGDDGNILLYEQH